MATAPTIQLEGWNAHMACMNDDALMLAELTHRVGNEVASAQAAIRMAIAKRDTANGHEFLSAALGRMDGFGVVLRTLNLPPDEVVDLGETLQLMCEGMFAARPKVRRERCTFEMPALEVDGYVARRVMMIAAELVQNALRHAMEGPEAGLKVVLSGHEGYVHLTVADQGGRVGFRAPSRGNGMGRPIIRELVRRADGRFECVTGPKGTVVRIALPINPDGTDGTMVE